VLNKPECTGPWTHASGQLQTIALHCTTSTAAAASSVSSTAAQSSGLFVELSCVVAVCVEKKQGWQHQAAAEFWHWLSVQQQHGTAATLERIKCTVHCATDRTHTAWHTSEFKRSNHQFRVNIFLQHTAES
jgi:hypothetical protein